jgi:hypothetical protein
MAQPLWKTSGILKYTSKNTTIHLSHDVHITFLSIYLREMEMYVCPITYMYVNVRSSFICNNSELETAKALLNRLMVKQTKVHPNHEILLVNKME